MRCEEIQDRLSAYLDAEMGPEDRLAIENHLEGCEGCRREAKLLRQTISTLHALEEIPVPADFRAKFQEALEARRTPWWRRLAARLLFPIHIKLPLEAMALLLITLGAVYLYRSAPELAKAPEPQVPPMAEKAPRGVAPSEPGAKRDRLEEAESGMAAGEGKPGRILQEKERDDGKREKAHRALRQEAPAAKAPSPIWELSLKTKDPSLAASRLAEIIPDLGGKLLEGQEKDQLLISLPVEAYPKFLEAIQELGSLTPPSQDTPTAAPPQQTLTISLRLTP